MNWLESAVKFKVGKHPKYYGNMGSIYIEAIHDHIYGDKWVVRCDGQALTKPGTELVAYHFFIERDFRGKEREQIMFDTKEEAYEAYLQWKEKGEDNGS